MGRLEIRCEDQWPKGAAMMNVAPKAEETTDRLLKGGWDLRRHVMVHSYIDHSREARFTMDNPTNKKGTHESEKIKNLIAMLGEKDGLKRRETRFELEKIGRIATPYLIEALHNTDHTVRWEAAKALGTVKDPEAGPALVEALMDESFEVQWLAAEALIALKEQAIVPILRALVSNYESEYIRQGAHHVLHALERENLLDDYSLDALDEVRDIGPKEPYPLKAKRALDKLTAGEKPGDKAYGSAGNIKRS